MARCNCNSQTCSCVIIPGANVSVNGAGTVANPYVIAMSSGGGGGGGGGWEPGDLKEVAYASTPAGWLECLGQAVSRTTYPELFNRIGTMYGIGDGVATFNLPSYTGRFRVGAGGSYMVGATGGSATVTIGVGNLPPHTHAMDHTHSISHDHPSFNTGSGGGHTHKLQITTNDKDKDYNSNNAVSAGAASGGRENAGPVETSGTHTHTINVPGHSGTSGGSSRNATGSTGSGQPLNNLPPYRVTRVLIKT